MKLDIEKLEGLAKAATPGPWVAADYGNYRGDSAHWYVDTDRPHDIVDDQDGGISPNHWDDLRGERDMKFIAAANPAAVLELIAEIGQLTADNRSKNGSFASFGKQISALQRAVKNRDKVLEKGSAERDNLKAENEALRKDAERYRWLRDQEALEGGIAILPVGLWVKPAMACTTPFDSGEMTDSVVDAAMAQDQQP